MRGAFFVAGREEPIPPHYRQVLIGMAPTGARATAVRASHLQAGRPLLACSLANDRNGAQALVGQWIYAERDEVKAEASKTGAVLWADMEGAEVVDAKGELLGRVHHVYNAGASDVVAVRASDGRTVDVPLVAEYVNLDRPLVFAPGAKPKLVLLVDAGVFAEVWDDQQDRGDA